MSMVMETEIYAEDPSSPMVVLKTIRGGHHKDFSSIVFELEREIEFEKPIIGEKEIFIALKNVTSKLAAFRNYKTFDSWVALEDAGENLNVWIGRPEKFLKMNYFLLINPCRLVVNLYEGKKPTRQSVAKVLKPEIPPIRVKIRGGLHENFSSIVFEFDKKLHSKNRSSAIRKHFLY